MSELNYREPLNKFLELGRPDTYNVKDWADYVSEYNLTDEHLPDLLKMLDVYTQPIDDFDEHDPASWTAIHVWRALGQLKNEQAIQPLIDAMMRDTWEDWGWEDIPQAIAFIGEPAIEPVKQELAKRATDYDLHPTSLVSTLQHIGDRDESLHERITDILIEQMEKAKANAPTLNGFIVSTFLDWKQEKALPVMEKAFAADSVDTSIAGDWEEVQVEFGLLSIDDIDVAAKNAKRRADRMRDLGMLPPLPDSLGLETGSLLSKKEQKKKKAKRKQAKKMQMQNRKKKK
jgi:hypothetical protein